ncbi:MAG: hypothetical protein ABIK79_15705 [Chloroflexota bacterium]
MSERNYDEKEEKEEKEEEKEEKEGKSWDEKYRRDPLSAIVWAVILIWVGVALLADNLGFLAGLRPLDAWDLVFIGAGVLVILEAVIRLLLPEYRQPVTGSLIFGVILLAIGLGDLMAWGTIWPVALIIIGASLVLRNLTSRR